MASGFKPGSHITGPVLQTDNRVASPRAWYGMLPAGFEPSVVQYFNDFIVPSDYTASDWDLVQVGSGSISQAQEMGGVLAITTGASANNTEALFLKDKWNTTALGQRLWFKTRISVDNFTNISVLVGLSDGSTNNRIDFELAPASQQLFANCTLATVSTRVFLGEFNLQTKYYTLAFVTDGTSVDFYIDNSLRTTITTNIPLASTLLRTSYQITTLSPAARTLKLDYTYTASQRYPRV